MSAICRVQILRFTRAQSLQRVFLNPRHPAICRAEDVLEREETGILVVSLETSAQSDRLGKSASGATMSNREGGSNMAEPL